MTLICLQYWTEDGGMLGGEGRVDRMFLECFAVAGLTQWVMEATFVSSGNTLDLFLTSEVDRVGSIEVHAPFPKCRHTPVVCIFLILILMLMYMMRFSQNICGLEETIVDCLMHYPGLTGKRTSSISQLIQHMRCF